MDTPLHCPVHPATLPPCLCLRVHHISACQIFVGGLDPSVSDDQLRQVFSAYGDILYVKIPFGKGCGFVQFGSR